MPTDTTQPTDGGVTVDRDATTVTTTDDGATTTTTTTTTDGTTTTTTTTVDTTTTVGATDWCPAGSSWSSSTAAHGVSSEVAAEIIGMVEYKGDMLCKATMEASRPSQPWYMMICDYYFNENETVCWIECKDDIGRTVFETSCTE